MDADKFIDIAYKCGYSTKGNAKKYVKDNPKEDYDMEYSLYLVKQIGVYAGGGTERLIESLRKLHRD